MRRFFSFLCGISLVAISCSEPVSPERASDASPAFSQHQTGNGAPSGAHYNLNIIGVSKDKTADMDGNNGHRIFVKLWGKTKINLTEGPTFAVLDANGTDADGAEFQLPNPDPDGDGYTWYSVFARPLGKPNGRAKLTTCAEDPTTGDEICSTNFEIFVRRVGRNNKPTFDNVSKELLTITFVLDPATHPALAACLNVNSVQEVTVGIFDPCLEDYFWEYDNYGLKLLQLRFYEVVTDVS